MSDFLLSWRRNEPYFESLRILASLSGLFSDGVIPYLDYRLAENVFCRFFDAENEARSCTAYDARVRELGVGIKTFILKHDQSTEKVAEFNRLKGELDPLDGVDLARKLGEFRNERIQFADNLYGTSSRIYHIVGRSANKLRVFNADYEKVDIGNISILKNDRANFSFSDGQGEYFFNRSKSVLIKRFCVPRDDYVDVSVKILEDPLEKIYDFLQVGNKRTFQVLPRQFGADGKLSPAMDCQRGFDYVILPLYGKRQGMCVVHEKSGLNQWNAAGRPRDPNEIYIPVPKFIHTRYPQFFPGRDEHFWLQLPNGTRLSAKICQDGGKALMSTHNADLGKWLLRQILHKPEGELVTMADLNRYGIDSVRIVNEHRSDESGRKIYSISFTLGAYESFAEFMGEIE